MDNKLMEAYIDNLKRLTARMSTILETLAIPSLTPSQWKLHLVEHQLILEKQVKLERRVHLLEAVLPSPHITEPATKDSPSDVGDTTIQPTPASSPWGPHIMTFRVVHGCGSALPTMVDKDNSPIRVFCHLCGALLELESIPAQGAARSTMDEGSGSTSQNQE